MLRIAYLPAACCYRALWGSDPATARFTSILHEHHWRRRSEVVMVCERAGLVLHDDNTITAREALPA